MQPTIGGILMVLGMVAVMAQPFLGVALIGAGYWLFNSSSASAQSSAASTFFGICLICMVVLAVAAFF